MTRSSSAPLDPDHLNLNAPRPAPPLVKPPTTLVYSVAYPVCFATRPAYSATALPRSAATLRTRRERERESFGGGGGANMNLTFPAMRRSQLSRLTEVARSCSGNGRAWPSISEIAELFINVCRRNERQ